ncbi:carbohydrate ABC transporter permease [Phototrophicus methaneseepsis]|uniref:Carbohydrate ABC transporter permease n=1 Tax=Phototrophicus methaneseepsis TaxID=2710758 RepID=A0A7S8E7Z1_9CHLR|nr:carbohydrate ABC transporter permease [Phototrophicus methaneseepsis]QPC82029.1 carbohydrate ABC transporter permease [Phototrophicus methaneseepsis]
MFKSLSGRRTLRYVVLIVLSLIWISPLLAIFIFSFAPNQDILRMEIFPTSFTLEHYNTVMTTTLRGVSIPTSLVNSTIIVVIQVLGVLILDIPAAYALARTNFFGRDIIFALILITMMMPGHIILMSLYEIMANMSLVNTLPGILLPGLPRVIGIFLLRQFFREIPNELEDAARLDGAGDWQIFLRIMVPLANPAIATLTVITVLYSWNNFLWPLVIINTPEMMTAPIAMAYLDSGTNATQNYADLLAAAFVTTLPVIVFFFAAQGRIIQGISPSSGIK